MVPEGLDCSCSAQPLDTPCSHAERDLEGLGRGEESQTLADRSSRIFASKVGA